MRFNLLYGLVAMLVLAACTDLPTQPPMLEQAPVALSECVDMGPGACDNPDDGVGGPQGEATIGSAVCGDNGTCIVAWTSNIDAGEMDYYVSDWPGINPPPGPCLINPNQRSGNCHVDLGIDNCPINGGQLPGDSFTFKIHVWGRGDSFMSQLYNGIDEDSVQMTLTCGPA